MTTSPDTTPPRTPHALVICLDTFGDITLRQPLFRSLIDHGYETTVLVRKGYDELVPFVDPRLRLLVTATNPHDLPNDATQGDLAYLRARLLAMRPDLVVAAAYTRTPLDAWIIERFPDARAVALSSGDWSHPHYKAWLGVFEAVGDPLVRNAAEVIPVDALSPEAEKNNALVEAIVGRPLVDYVPVLTLDAGAAAASRSILSLLGLEPGRYIVGCPAGNLKAKLKAMPIEGFAAAARAALRDRSEAILIIGHDDERAHVEASADACRAKGLQVRTWLGRRGHLGTLLGLIRHAALYLGADTGPMHFASAFGVPVVAVFGGGHWPRFLPEARTFHVATQKLPCFGCGWSCILSEPACITAVSFDRVGEAAERILSGQRVKTVDMGPGIPTAAFEALKAEPGGAAVPLPAPPVRRKPASGDLPWIDVVVPSFNQGQFLREALSSIFHQDYPRVAVYVLDGGSTDETALVLGDFAHRLRYWRMRSDDGQSAAIQEGVARGSGDLVAWLNSDDFYLPGALWRLARAFSRHPGYGLYIGNGFRYSQAQHSFAPFCRRHLALNRQALAEGLDYVLQPSTFFSRDAWERAGGLDQSLRYGMDWDLILRIAASERAVLINEFLAASREWESTKTSSGGWTRIQELLRIAERHTHRSMTPGSLYYALEEMLSSSRDVVSNPTRHHVHEVLRSLQAEFAAAYGNSDGFPEHGDPQDVVDLPVPTAPKATDVTIASAPRSFPDPAPTISIVTPSLNQARFLGQALDSVLNQGYPELELLVFDGGSKDGSADVLRSLGPRLAHWVSEPDGGPAAAINKGLSRATGEIVSWLNSDDMLAEDALAEVSRAFTSDPSLDVVYGNALYVDDAGKLSCPDHGGYRTGLYYGAFQTLGHIPRYWTYVHSVPQPTVFFRRSLLEKVGPLDEGYHFIFDFELFARFVARGARIHKIEKTLAFYRLHTGGKTNDWSRFLQELYRFSRPRWPPVWSRGFRRTLRSFLASYVRRQVGTASPRWVAPLIAALASLMIVTRIGNPESIGPRLARAARRFARS